MNTNCIDIIDDKECNGCMACVEICKNSAISLIEKRGFQHPSVDATRCCNCGRCVSACSSMKHGKGKLPKNAYVCVSKNKEIYNNGSSGGVFGTIAKHYISNLKGCAIGAAMSDDRTVKHIFVTENSELHNIQGSKYVQSSCAGIYNDVKKLLLSGREVVFSGTPCQVAAIRNFLGENYEGLLCIDIVCHGVPSPSFFKYYMDKHYGKFAGHPLHFRTKDIYDRYGFNLKFELPGRCVIVPGRMDLYYRMFLNGISFRESCYRCPYANMYRMGDITIGDCGNSNKHHSFHVDSTISTVYINTKKGEDCWNDIKQYFYYQLADIEEEVAANAQLNFPSARPLCRDDMFANEEYNLTEINAAKYLGKVSILLILKERLKRIIPERTRRAITSVIGGNKS